ncbi:MAG: hypothetical protein L6405_02200 [Actinomycetia bacterium]|nr:hypothetical protein [Actinomycetota bacterium]MCG2788747.1 hypothetical protein [Actinomycetes bacterium]
MNRKYMDLSLKQTTNHLAKLVSLGSFLKGNTVTMKRTCGNKNCRCAKLGEKHISMYLAKKQNNTTKMVYVPKNLEEEISAKVKAYHKIKDLTEKISEINYEMLNLKKKGDVKKDN